MGKTSSEHRRFKRGAASIGARFRGSGTSYNGFSENFLVGREDFGGRHKNSSVFGRKPAAFTTNSVGTRLNKAHQDLVG